jgi:antitoxin HicB
LTGRTARVFFTAGEGKMILLHGFIKKSQKTRRMIWHWRKPGCECYNNVMNGKHIGSDFDEFLKQEGLLAECEAGALKRVVTWQIQEEMKRRRITRAKLASRMKTSRNNLNRLFSENDSAVSLQLLEQVALALGRKLKVELA